MSCVAALALRAKQRQRVLQLAKRWSLMPAMAPVRFTILVRQTVVILASLTLRLMWPWPRINVWSEYQTWNGVAAVAPLAGTGIRFHLGLQTPSSDVSTLVILAMSVAILTILETFGAVNQKAQLRVHSAAAVSIMWPAIEGLLTKPY